MFVLIRQEDLWITKHAAEKMVIEGITTEQILVALERGSRFPQTDGYLCVHGYVSVAYKRVGDKYKIKTVFITR